MKKHNVSEGLVCEEKLGVSFCHFDGLCEAKREKFSDLVIQLEDTHGFRVTPTSYLINKGTAAKPYC